MNPADALTLWQVVTRIFVLLNTGLGCTLIGLILKNRIDNRKLTIEENKGLRKEFIDEMAALRGEVKDLRLENDALRTEVRALHGIIDGLRRESLQSGLSTQRAVVDSLPREIVPPSTLEALDRLPGSSKGK